MSQQLDKQPTKNQTTVTQQQENAKRLVQLLDESTTNLDSAIVDRLAQARQQAVAAMSAASPGASRGLLRWFNDFTSQHRAFVPTAALCGAVFMAFIVTQQLASPSSAEQGDAFLLASDLPPEAYVDRGFDLWLAQNSRH